MRDITEAQHAHHDSVSIDYGQAVLTTIYYNIILICISAGECAIGLDFNPNAHSPALDRLSTK
jgi:hypothetical protein